MRDREREREKAVGRESQWACELGVVSTLTRKDLFWLLSGLPWRPQDHPLWSVLCAVLLLSLVESLRFRWISVPFACLPPPPCSGLNLALLGLALWPLIWLRKRKRKRGFVFGNHTFNLLFRYSPSLSFLRWLRSESSQSCHLCEPSMGVAEIRVWMLQKQKFTESLPLLPFSFPARSRLDHLEFSFWKKVRNFTLFVLLRSETFNLSLMAF